MADKTWSAAGNSSASVDASWSGGTKPVAGDNIIFDATSSTNCTWDLALTLGTFNLNAGYGGTVSLTRDITVSNFTIAAGTFDGKGPTNGNYLSVTGNFLQTGGTITSGKLQLYMTGAAKTTTLTADPNFYSFTCSGATCSISCASAFTTRIYTLDTAGCTFAMDANMEVTGKTTAGYSHFDNFPTTGLVTSGAGAITATYADGDETARAAGTINNPMVYQASAAASANRITTGTGSTYGSTFNINSLHASRTMEYRSAANHTFTGAVTIGDRGILTQTGGTWAFGNNLVLSGAAATATVAGNVAGAVTQSGASSQMTLYNNMAVTGDYNLSDGNLNLNGKALTCANFVKTGGTVTYGGGTINGVGDVYTWVADAPAAASTAASWSPVGVPGAGSELIFNSTHTGACSWDIAAAMGTFTVGAGSPAISIAASMSTKGLTTAANTTITVATTKVMTILLYSGYTYSHAGTLAGAGTGAVTFELHDAAFSPTFGTVTCPATITLNAAAAASRICTLGANTTFGSTLTVSSAHAANTLTLTHGTNFTLTVGGLCTLSTRAIMTQGTGTWTFTGGLTVSGASSVFTQGGTIACNGDYTQSDGTLTGSNSATKPFNCSGDFTRSAGTITAGKMFLTMTGASKTLSAVAELSFLTCSGTIACALDTTVYDLLVTGSVTIATGKYLSAYFGYTGYGTNTFSNTGDIIGPGTLRFYMLDKNNAACFGRISAPVAVTSTASQTADCTAALFTPVEVYNTITVSSGHAAFTVALDIGGYVLRAKAIAITARGIVKSTVAGGRLYIGTIGLGGIVVTANGLLDRTNIQYVKVYGIFDTSAGSTTTGTDTLILCGPGSRSLKMTAGQTLYNLAIANDPQVVLGSNLTVSNELVMAADNITYGAYTITFNGGGANWYDRRRMHIQRQVGPTVRNHGRGDAILDYLPEMGAYY